jgi:epsin
MNEIAQMTYSQNEFVEVMEMLDKRLNDKGKNWRHVFKVSVGVVFRYALAVCKAELCHRYVPLDVPTSLRRLDCRPPDPQALTLLDYILHAGSENVVIYFRDNIYIVKTLKEFVYVDDDGQDVGANVRQKAKDITNLLQDEDRLRMERKSRGAMRERMLGNIAESGLRGEDDRGEPERRAERNNNNSGYKPAKTRDEDDDLKRAIEESKRAAMDDESRSRARNQECVDGCTLV